jgi:hypothetical protein
MPSRPAGDPRHLQRRGAQHHGDLERIGGGPGNRQAWFSARQAQGYPILVAVENDEVLGYASFGDWRPFDGFVTPSSTRSTYAATSAAMAWPAVDGRPDRTRGTGKHVMVAAIESGNQASIRLHERPASSPPGRCRRWAPSSAAGST